MKITSWMNQGRPYRLTAGELNVIFNIQSHPFFEQLYKDNNSKCLMIKIKDLVWNLDELFANIYLITKNEKFQNFCKEKSEKEGVPYIDVLKKEVNEYQVTSDIINDNHIVENVVNFITPRIKKILDYAQNCEPAIIKDVFKDGARQIYAEALREKEEEYHSFFGMLNEKITDNMFFREDLSLEEFNKSYTDPSHIWNPSDI